MQHPKHDNFYLFLLIRLIFLYFETVIYLHWSIFYDILEQLQKKKLVFLSYGALRWMILTRAKQKEQLKSLICMTSSFSRFFSVTLESINKVGLRGN